MGAVNDFVEEIKSLIKTPSVPVKVFWALSICLNLLVLLSSISDLIVSSRRLLLDTLVFYDSYISNPLTNLFSLVGLNFDRIEIDVFILITMFYMANSMSYISVWKITGTPASKFIAFLYSGINLFAWIIVTLFLGHLEFSRSEGMMLCSILFLSTTTSALMFIKKKHWSRSLAYTCGPFLTSVLLLLLIAGINAGLKASLD